MKDRETARKMGCAMARLHAAFAACEEEIGSWDNSLLQEMKGWIKENLAGDRWQIMSKDEYETAVGQLEKAYDDLPKQLIHRDVHFGNFLFFEGDLSGYIDFDLSQRNIRIFDICYFLGGLLTEETDEPFSKNEWLESIRAVIDGYESILPLSEAEKDMIPCVMECIEILFIAYHIGKGDHKCATQARHIFRFIQSCEKDIRRCRQKYTHDPETQNL